MKCLTACIADNIDFAMLDSLSLFTLEKALAKDVVLVRNQLNYELFIFNNGTIVLWDADKTQALDLISTLKPALINPIDDVMIEHLDYICDPQQQTSMSPQEKIGDDMIILHENSEKLKLSISYGLSRSIKLRHFDHKLESMINKYTPLAKSIYLHGKIKMSHRGVIKIIGELMVNKVELNLVNNFIYQPAFFWANPSLERDYVMVKKYMDIEIRAETLNQRLDTLNEIFTLLNSYLEYRRSLFFEIAITVFVGIEVLFSILAFHF